MPELLFFMHQSKICLQNWDLIPAESQNFINSTVYKDFLTFTPHVNESKHTVELVVEGDRFDLYGFLFILTTRYLVKLI